MNADVRRKPQFSVMMALIDAVQGAFQPVLTIHLADLGISEQAVAQSVYTVINGGLGSMTVRLLAGELVHWLPDRLGLVFVGPGRLIWSLFWFWARDSPPPDLDATAEAAIGAPEPAWKPSQRWLKWNQ